MAALKKIPVVRMRGEVVKGFGRGSKMLGVPTANMEIKERTIIEEIPAGIYAGWSQIAGKEDVYKTVLSIGWNPFFKDVKQKTVEPHLIHKFDQDFYGAQLSLVITGHIRGEKNFDSLESLIKAINSDIRIATEGLATAEHLACRTDPFLKATAPAVAATDESNAAAKI